ncbi:hypothetical protein ACWT_2263 [Actinoplanes sp. SE50]|uniref:hypothetical protein n=1 Tax=unclassified Actinoplanes TaxID=2626549 RepID=UPI00023ED01F|nr:MULTISPECIES: hypothetical protein [unclassified Actinoplanes]AEV83285.1 hypothetical protein ACPL_2390 [Actinoplanes sp. SE50/110]ATO81678.1 hypothetical protein ACWT_2263 [Actinoplanes sp. SE50]SLL99086.1 uncharacterized protein ACSP50_2314 [Actinoplanes sp. SE50/110]
MRTFELAEMLREVPGTEVTAGPGLVTVHIPAIGDTLRIAFRDVLDADWVHVPTGEPAVQVDLRRGHQSLPLIITVDDVVFTPSYADDLVDPEDHLLVPAMPSLIAYSEMHRDVRALGKALDDPRVQLADEVLAATLTAHRCFLAGAMRVGLWPVRVAAWWEYTSARSAGQVRVARFLPDPRWDELMHGVQEARQTQFEQENLRVIR